MGGLRISRRGRLEGVERIVHFELNVLSHAELRPDGEAKIVRAVNSQVGADKLATNASPDHAGEVVLKRSQEAHAGVAAGFGVLANVETNIHAKGTHLVTADDVK